MAMHLDAEAFHELPKATRDELTDWLLSQGTPHWDEEFQLLPSVVEELPCYGSDNLPEDTSVLLYDVGRDEGRIHLAFFPLVLSVDGSFRYIPIASYVIDETTPLPQHLEQHFVPC